MTRLNKPQIITFPDEFAIEIQPGQAVDVGGEVFIILTYKNGDYNTHQPSLELLRGPNEFPATPKPFGTVAQEGKKTVFKFIAGEVGVYGLRLRPFSCIEIGRFLEIHSVSAEEKQAVEDVIPAMTKQS